MHHRPGPGITDEDIEAAFEMLSIPPWAATIARYTLNRAAREALARRFKTYDAAVLLRAAAELIARRRFRIDDDNLVAHLGDLADELAPSMMPPDAPALTDQPPTAAEIAQGRARLEALTRSSPPSSSWNDEKQLRHQIATGCPPLCLLRKIRTARTAEDIDAIVADYLPTFKTIRNSRGGGLKPPSRPLIPKFERIPAWT